MKEEWRDIRGYEGIYQVSNLGNVKSLPRTLPHARYGTRTYKGKRRALRFDDDGYLSVTLCRSGTVKGFRVHRLVADAFIGECAEDMVVMHIDDNPSNNQVDNLRIGTVRENLEDCFSKGRGRRGDYQKEKTHCPRGHEYVPSNVPEGKKKQVLRCCRSCANARSYLRRQGLRGDEALPMFQEISDRYFEKYKKEGSK